MASLGLVETEGWVGAIEAADTGLKAANVELVGYEITQWGLITVKFTGDVAAVMAAVQSAAAAAEKVGKVAAVLVIPRPDHQIGKMTIHKHDHYLPSAMTEKPPVPEKNHEADVEEKDASGAPKEIPKKKQLKTATDDTKKDGGSSGPKKTKPGKKKNRKKDI
jgi:ethanolamine utilization protein EutM